MYKCVHTRRVRVKYGKRSEMTGIQSCGLVHGPFSMSSLIDDLTRRGLEFATERELAQHLRSDVRPLARKIVAYVCDGGCRGVGALAEWLLEQPAAADSDDAAALSVRACKRLYSCAGGGSKQASGEKRCDRGDGSAEEASSGGRSSIRRKGRA